MSDKRDMGLTVEDYRDALVPSYQTVIMKLMGGYQSQIHTHDFNTEKVITKKDLLDVNSVVPTVFNTEMSEVNHAKFYPVGDTFAAVGMYLGFTINQKNQGSRQSMHNAVLRELTIAWDRAALVGEFGNKGLLQSGVNDPMRKTMQSVQLPAASATFDVRAKAVKAMGTAIKDMIDETSASDSLSIVVYGSVLQNYMTDTNSATDVATLYDYFRKGFGSKYINIIEVPAVALKNTSLAGANGMAVISNGTLELDTTEYPDIDKTGERSDESGDRDWSRFKVGSAQFKTNIEGGIINQEITFAS